MVGGIAGSWHFDSEHCRRLPCLENAHVGSFPKIRIGFRVEGLGWVTWGPHNKDHCILEVYMGTTFRTETACSTLHIIFTILLLLLLLLSNILNITITSTITITITSIIYYGFNLL